MFIMRILVVEDDKKIANALKLGLERQSYAVDVRYDGDSGHDMAMSENYDIMILDRMIPGQYDGLAILQDLRKSGRQVPVLFLTAKDKVLDKVEGINAGADDYLAKPFAFLELLARVRALLRRPKQSLGDEILYNDLKLNRQTKVVNRNGKNIDLSSLEFALLEYLMRNVGKTLSKDNIIEHVWDYDADVLPNTVEVYIGYLRNKLEKPFRKSGPLIHTKRGFGYVFGDQK
jgi:DNA-binding response OmpR family regulator